MTRQAISPRFAINTFWKGRSSSVDNEMYVDEVDEENAAVAVDDERTDDDHDDDHDDRRVTTADLNRIIVADQKEGLKDQC